MSHEPKYVATSFIDSHKSQVPDDRFAQNTLPLFASQEVGLDQHQEDWDFGAFYVVFGRPESIEAKLDYNAHNENSAVSPSHDSLELVSISVEPATEEVEESSPTFLCPLIAYCAEEGEIFSLSTVVSGYPLPEVTWFTEDQPLVDNEHITETKAGKHCMLTISGATLEDGGIFSCHAVNTVGRAWCFAVVVVVPADAVLTSVDMNEQLTSAMSKSESLAVTFVESRMFLVAAESATVICSPNEGVTGDGITCTNPASATDSLVAFNGADPVLVIADKKQPASATGTSSMLVPDCIPEDEKERGANRRGMVPSKSPVSVFCESPQMSSDKLAVTGKSNSFISADGHAAVKETANLTMPKKYWLPGSKKE